MPATDTERSAPAGLPGDGWGRDAAFGSPGEILFRRLPLELPTRPPAPAATRRDQACRALNVVLASLGLILAAPLMVAIALAVRLTSSGPVLYTQRRVGVDRRDGSKAEAFRDRRKRDYGGRIFTIYKFRTMYVRDEDDQVWACPDDPRVTPVGRLLRKYRLDELPQLWNVLRGDMNIVGPRPEQPEIFVELREQVERYQDRQKVLPGITGWAQVNHHYDQSIDDVKKKVELDLQYIDRRSAVEDMKILARTVPVVLRRKGAI